MTGDTRAGLLAEPTVVSRRHMAAHALFGQAFADHLGPRPTGLQCLSLLTPEGGPVSTGRIAELTGLTTGSATRLVDRLERAGYVVRERDAGDRRLVLVAVVPERAAGFGRLVRALRRPRRRAARPVHRPHEAYDGVQRGAGGAAAGGWCRGGGIVRHGPPFQRYS